MEGLCTRLIIELTLARRGAGDQPPNSLTADWTQDESTHFKPWRLKPLNIGLAIRTGPNTLVVEIQTPESKRGEILRGVYMAPWHAAKFRSVFNRNREHLLQSGFELPDPPTTHNSPRRVAPEPHRPLVQTGQKHLVPIHTQRLEEGRTPEPRASRPGHRRGLLTATNAHVVRQFWLRSFGRAPDTTTRDSHLWATCGR